ncbi:AAA family ATPase [Clostridium gasigenes]|nr:AAA family ATPase [Clostridium gasigenes]QSW18301.1 AAA family ATPase [Clostridium gasigenes]
MKVELIIKGNLKVIDDFVDKSMMIETTNKLINRANNYLCIARPRRFGKSSVASILASYYSKTVQSILHDIHNSEIPILKYSDENSLSCVLTLAYLAARDTYRVEREEKSGKGYSDFSFHPRRKNDIPVCAVYADGYNGYIYALADKENNRFIYVEINFCNYFSDINYEDIIDEEYLPIDFDAKSGNSTRQAFENGEL